MYIDLLESQISSNHSALVQLVKQCLHNDPRQRPSTDELLATLQRMKVEVEGQYGIQIRLDMEKLRLAKEVKELKEQQVYIILVMGYHMSKVATSIQERYEVETEVMTREVEEKTREVEEKTREVEEKTREVEVRDILCIIVSHYHRHIVQVRDRHNQELQEQVQTKDREIATHRHHFQQQQEEKNGQIQHLQNTIQTLTTEMEVGRPDLFSLPIHIILSAGVTYRSPKETANERC